MTLSAVLLLSLLLAIVAYWLITALAEHSKQRHYAQPPRYRHTDPFFGIDRFRALSKARKSAKFIAATDRDHKIYGKTFQHNFFGTRVIVTSQPDVIKAVHTTSFDNFGLEALRLPAWGPSLGRGVFDTDGAEWQHSRALLRPAFARQQIANVEALELHTERLLKLIPRDGSTVDLSLLFHRFGLDTITDFVFGQSADSLLPDPSKETLEFLEAAGVFWEFLSKAAFFGKYHWLVFNKEFYRVREMLWKFTDSKVARALDEMKSKAGEDEGASKRIVLLEEVAKETKDPIELRFETLQTFLAGKDGSYMLLTNVFFDLARSPNSWKTLRDEVTAIDPQQSLTFDFLKSLQYTQACLKETLRLHPAINSAMRTCLKDTVLPLGGGKDCQSPILVRKGDLVEANIWSLHHDTDVWGPDAAEFRPERWASARPGWGFLAFLGGPRICPAIQMMYVECAYVMVRIVREFSGLENRDPVVEWVEHLSTGAFSKNGAKVGLTPA